MTSAASGPRAELHAPFRPRAARVVTSVIGAASVVLAVLLAVLIPADQAALFDRVAFVALSLLVAWFLHRHGSVQARPDEQGVTVRNLIYTRRLEWAQIVAVRFGDRPWVQLDLDDGEILAVMAIQRADGERSRREATRLATLVALHSATPRDD